MIVTMMMVVPMRMAAMGVIGAPRRLERLADLGDNSAQPFEHGADHVVAQDQDALLLDLRGEMPVAQMPGEFDEMPAVARADFEKLFIRRNDLDQLAILAHQQIAARKQDRLLEVEHDHLAIFEMQQLAAQMPEIMRQDDTIDRIGGRRAGRQIGGDA